MRVVSYGVAVLLVAGCQAMPPPEQQAKAEISDMMQKWIDGMTRHDAQAVVGLYDPDAVLWGTRSPVLRDRPELIRDYYKLLQTVPPSYKVTLGQQRIRVYGDTAINTGTYTFSETHDGKETVRPARFSFVYHYRMGRWWIVDHHSSASPV
jgi:uncharacterized protein (TIGR02246 family)